MIGNDETNKVEVRICLLMNTNRQKKVEFIRVNVSKTKIKSGKNRTENIDYTLK